MKYELKIWTKKIWTNYEIWTKKIWTKNVYLHQELLLQRFGGVDDLDAGIGTRVLQHGAGKLHHFLERRHYPVAVQQILARLYVHQRWKSDGKNNYEWAKRTKFLLAVIYGSACRHSIGSDPGHPATWHLNVRSVTEPFLCDWAMNLLADNDVN